jgi:FlaA1/EpsC-like NDP-sugar epimerase
MLKIHDIVAKNGLIIYLHLCQHIFMIVITGSAGFIGSCLVSKFNQQGIFDLILVDDFSKHEKDLNLLDKKFEKKN